MQLIISPSSGSTTPTVTNKTTTYAIQTSDFGNTLTFTGTGGAFTTTLPTAIGLDGKFIYLVRTDQTLANQVTVATTSSQTIGPHGTSVTLATQGEGWFLQSDGANWLVLDHTIPSFLTSVTPTYAGLGTVTAEGTWWWRGPDGLFYMRGVNVTGTVTGSTVSVSIPSGLTIDSSFLGSATDTNIMGEFFIMAGTTNPIFPTTSAGPYPFFPDTSVANNLLYFSRQTAAGRLGKEVGSLIGNTTRFSFNIKGLPITGWKG